MEVFTKIDTLYKRYAFDAKTCPNQKWLKFRNKIILGEFSDKEAQYLFHCPWEAYSKIDGTNSKIAFFPSTGEFKVEGKTEKAESQHGQFELLQEIGERIKSQLRELFPPECARFTPVKGDNNKVEYWDKELYDTVTPTTAGFYGVELEEVPIYIYGEYFGEGIQKCGKRYITKGNDFVVFDIKQQGWWTPKDVRDSLCEKLGLKTVPFIGVMTLADIEDMVRKGFATKFGAADPTLLEEGIVARPIIPLFDGSNKRIIVKVKYCDYIEYDAVRKEFSDEEFAEFDKWYHENAETLYKK